MALPLGLQPEIFAKMMMMCWSAERVANYCICNVRHEQNLEANTTKCRHTDWPHLLLHLVVEQRFRVQLMSTLFG